VRREEGRETEREGRRKTKGEGEGKGELHVEDVNSLETLRVVCFVNISQLFEGVEAWKVVMFSGQSVQVLYPEVSKNWTTRLQGHLLSSERGKEEQKEEGKEGEKG
jgi:hypothetical protein